MMLCLPVLLSNLVGWCDTQVPPQENPTAIVAGRIVDLRGEGVTAAKVWVVHHSEPDKVLARSTADAEGYFRIGRVPMRDTWKVMGTGAGRSVGVSFVRGRNDTAHITVHDATTLRGVLRLADGTPAAGVAVRAEPAGRSLRHRSLATTDDKGQFALEKVPLGLTQLTAWIPGTGLVEQRTRVTGDAEVTLEATGEATTAFDITVDGLPAESSPEVVINWLPYRNGHLTYLPPPFYRPLIQGGQWRGEGLPDWRYVVRLSATGYAFQPDRIEAKAGTGPHQLGFVARKLGLDTLDCKAVVTGPDNQPAAGVSFVMRKSNGGARATATSDKEGRLTFASPLAPDTKVVVYSTSNSWVIDQTKGSGMYGTWDRRFLEDHECVVDPARTLQLSVCPASEVRGTLLRADGKPAPFVRLKLEEGKSNRMPNWTTFAYTTTTRDGSFHFRRLHHSPAPVRVLVEGRSGTAVSEELSIKEMGSRVVVPALKLAAPATVKGVVLDANGQPAPGITVWLRDWNLPAGQQRSGSVTEVITDRRGRYRFLGVPIGGAYLQLIGDNLNGLAGRAVEPFEVEPGETYRFELVANDQ